MLEFICIFVYSLILILCGEVGILVQIRKEAPDLYTEWVQRRDEKGADE